MAYRLHLSLAITKLLRLVSGEGCKTRWKSSGSPAGVALTVPDLASGLASVAETDLIATMLRRFVAMHTARFAVVSREVPLRLRAFSITAVPRAALLDAGLGWLFEVMCEAVQGGRQTERGAEARTAS